MRYFLFSLLTLISLELYAQDHPEYASLKRLAFQVASIIDSADSDKKRTRRAEVDAFMKIAGPEWEDNWVFGEGS